MKMNQPRVYIVANKPRGKVYIGKTPNLLQRCIWHKLHVGESLKTAYQCDILVWYEVHDTVESAKAREAEIKSASRKRQLELIEKVNPNWTDLYAQLY